MCGVAGFFYSVSNARPSWATAQTLSQMLEAIHHRGPDGRGMELGVGYGLGHVRLSIIDLSDMGAQPMWCAERRYALTYNGEIYNYKMLRGQLEQKGINFRSECDTEVLLYGLIVWGADFFSKLEGMFAGAFLDTQTGETMLFRDQLGIKPLYYTQTNDGIIFASEVKALRPVLGSFSLNRNAMYEQMNFRYVAGEHTLYEGVKRLLPGHFIKISSDGRVNLHRYYDLKDTLKNKGDFSREEIESAINNSIHAHTMSDVGYCIQLSGGIDSTYITHVLSGSKNVLDTYSVIMPNAPESEEEYQHIAAQKCGTKHHVFACDGEMFASLLPKVIEHLDFPVVHAGSVFLYKLCSDIARDGHKVVLTGEGADELFLGYSRYNITWAEQIAFRVKQSGFSDTLIPDLPKFRAIKSLMQREPWVRTGMYDSDVIGHVLNFSGDYLYRQERVADVTTIVDQMMMSDQHAYLGSLLERQDKISMAHGLEVRVPFCNHRLYEMMNALSFKAKTNPVPKAILKELLAQHFPHDFVYRRKNGFRIPLAEWIRDEKMLGRYLDYLRDDTFRQRGIYNTATVTQMVDDHLKGIKNYGQEIFSILSFEIWARGVNIE